jgi:hypothetical protein
MAGDTKNSNQVTDGGSVAAGMSPNVTQALALLDQVVALLALPTKVLTTKQRRAAARSRKGMERVIPTLASLSAEHGVSVPKQPTSAMTAALELAEQLGAVQSKLTSVGVLVGTNVDDARSSAWTTATTLYGMLKKVAHRDAQLKSQLAPVTEFFAYRTPGAKKAHPKQKGKKAALQAQKEAAAKATATDAAAGTATAPAAPSNGSAAGSTNAGTPAPSNGGTTHAG